MAKKLTKKERDNYSVELMRKRNRLTGNIQDLEGEVRPSGNQMVSNVSSGDTADKGSGSYEQDLSLTLLENEGDAVQLIDDALERLREGSFGVCLDCESAIAKARLKAVPWAPYCIDCQRQQEAS